jgi:hypothetical protein
VRLPFTSEPDAFRFAYGLAFVVGVSVLVGSVVGTAAGVAVFTLIALAALVWDVTAVDPVRRRAVLREAEWEGHELGAAERCALVIANDALTDDAVWAELKRERQSPPAIEVLAPVLQSKTHFVTTDIDREVEDARHRLEATLEAAHTHGLEAHGEVSDPIDPFASIADELRRHDVDEVIVATHREHPGWLEKDMLARMRSQLDVPLKQVAID